MLKRLFDIFWSFTGLIVLSPLLFAIALVIKISSPGPIFYRGRRVGQYGTPFRMYKFRTMVINAEKIGGPSTAADDPRVTPIGKALRKYKLDELPQLINVFTGEMSFVGPRPEVQEVVDVYGEKEKPLLQLKPGITDYASLWNIDEGIILKGSKDPHKAYMEKIWPTKVKLQLKYLREQSLWTDIKIILKTLKHIIS